MAEILSTLSLNGDKGTPANGGDQYVSSVTWESAQQAVHTSSDTSTLEVYSDYVASESLNWDWPTASSSAPCTIRAATGESHGGDPAAGARLQNNSATNATITTRAQGFYLEDMRVHNAATSTGTLFSAATGSSDTNIFRCIFSRNAQGADTSKVCISAATSDVVLRVFNTLIEGGGYGIRTSNAVTLCINVTARFYGGYGFAKGPGGVFTCDNCVAYSEVDGFEIDGFTGTIAGDNNASERTSAPGTNPQHNITGAAFTDFAGGDYSPAAGGQLDGTGVDRSVRFTDDITGGTRDGWDIGAWAESYAGGAPTFDDTNAFTITIGAGGRRKVNVLVGGVWKEAEASVLIGGAWKEAEASVLIGGAWEDVDA